MNALCPHRSALLALLTAVLLSAAISVSHSGVVASPPVAAVAVPAGPTVAMPAATVSLPPAPRDLVLASVSGRVGDGPLQLGPDFVADLADRPQSLKLTVMIANRGSEAVLAYPDLVNLPYQFVRARTPGAARVEPGSTRSFELEYRLRGLYDVKMLEIPFAVGVIASPEYQDEMPANNTINCQLILGRPDIVVTAVRVEPWAMGDWPPGPGVQHLQATVQAFVTIENQGQGRLPEGCARLGWSALWKKAFILWGEPVDQPITMANGSTLAGPVGAPVTLPALDPGASMVMWLNEFGSHDAKLTEGRLVLTLTVDCTPRAGETTYDEANLLNNRKTFDVAYRLQDATAYHPYRGLDYANR